MMFRPPILSFRSTISSAPSTYHGVLRARSLNLRSHALNLRQDDSTIKPSTSTTAAICLMMTGTATSYYTTAAARTSRHGCVAITHRFRLIYGPSSTNNMTTTQMNCIHTSGAIVPLLPLRLPWHLFASRNFLTLENIRTIGLRHRSVVTSRPTLYQYSQHQRIIPPKSNATFSYRSSSSTSTHSRSWMAWYEQQLATRPIITKMITGSFLWGIGDMVAQFIPQFSHATNENDSTSSSSSFTYDYIRTGRAALFGCVIHAPLSHLHYNFLESLTVQMKFTGYYIPIFKAFMEQFVYWSWISNSIYFAAMGAMQGMNLSQIYQRIYDVLWETQVAQWTFWIPIQLINFQYTPVRHQLNVVLITSIVWTALLSMWYPPIQKEKDDTPENAPVAPK